MESRSTSRPSSKIISGHTRQQSSQKFNLSSLRAATIITVKPHLPAEIMALLLDRLPVPELMRCARVSKRLKEMVYDDTRWIQKLRMMGIWNESQARQFAEEGYKRGNPTQGKPAGGPTSPTQVTKQSPISGPRGRAGPPQTSGTLFDAGWEEQRHAANRKDLGSTSDGFAPAPLSANLSQPTAAQLLKEPNDALGVVSRMRSIRGQARQEFGKIYGQLAPFYHDISHSKTYADLKVFRTFKEPEEQAKILAQLQVFKKSDSAQGWAKREVQFNSVFEIFETAALQEFERGLSQRSLGGSMKRYAEVLVTLNGGDAAIESYIRRNWLLTERSKLGNCMDCLRTATVGDVNLLPARDFFEGLLNALLEEARSIDRVFPPSVDVLGPLCDRVMEAVVTPYITPLFDEAHLRGVEGYVKVVPGVFEQSAILVSSLQPAKGCPPDFEQRLHATLRRVFEPHIDLYLREELDFIRKQTTDKVEQWQKQISEQQASAESFFMSNIHRQAAKKDFLSSFKKVLMTPVNAFPAWSKESKPSIEASRSNSPDPKEDLNEKAASLRPMSYQREAPSTELEAKAAIMNSKLEGIGTLFSIEVAITVIQAAKASIERLSRFVKLGGTIGDDARSRCEAVFLTVLQILGFGHIKPGFDLALDHLSSYSAREATEHGQAGVKPLITFLELVNIGDLMQQMVDVFYLQELVNPKLSDPEDFLGGPVKEKKRFEQMIDERVAAGLSKGIDALMDEVEFICATTQLPTDYNPEAAKDSKIGVMDIGTTRTAKDVVRLVSQHTDMLIGSTDKNTLDVFNQEVGVRLHSALCKHIKRQRISIEGAVNLISDTNHYFEFVTHFKNRELLQYFNALKNVSQIFLIDGKRGKEIGELIADGERYQGIFTAEEVYEFAERRSDWYSIKYAVEKAMYGACVVM